MGDLGVRRPLTAVVHFIVYPTFLRIGDFEITSFGVMVALGALAVWMVLRLVDAPAGPRARSRDLLLIVLSQGAIGYVQYALDEPEWLVGIHMFGSALVWIAMLRLLLSTRERGLAPGPEVHAEPSAGDPAAKEPQPV